MRPPDRIMLFITLLAAVYLHPYSVVEFATTMATASAADASGGTVSMLSEDEGEEQPGGVNKSKKAAKQRAKVKKEPTEDVCYLCEQPGDLTCSLNGHAFDHKCHLAVRRHRRLLPTKDARLADDQKMDSEPDAWRDELNVVAAPGAGGYVPRSALAVHRAKHVKENFIEETHEGGTYLLNKTRYKSYRAFWDRTGSESASEDFDRILDEASTDNEKDGEPRIKAEKIGEVSWKQGRRSSVVRHGGEASGSRGGRDASPRRRRS